MDPLLKENPFTIRSTAPRVVALATATLVIAAGALLSGIPAFSSAGETGLSIARTAAFGFDSVFGDIPQHLVMHVDAVSTRMAAVAMSITAKDGRATATLASPLLSHLDFSSLRMPVGAYDALAYESVRAVSSTPVLGHARVAIASARRFVSDPSRAMFALADAYRSIGATIYGGIVTALSSYEKLIGSAGTGMLTLAANARDAAATAPSAALRTEIALGTLIINGSHTVINADVTVAYALAAALPEASQSFAFVTYKTGDALATAASRAPTLVAAGFLWVTEAPTTIAPEVAQAVFNVEYVGATRFIALTDAVTGNYWRAVTLTGQTVYALAAGTSDFSQKETGAALALFGRASQAVAAVARAASSNASP